MSKDAAFANVPATAYNSIRPGHHLSHSGGGIKMRIGAFRTWRAALPAALVSSTLLISAGALTALPGTASCGSGWRRLRAGPLMQSSPDGYLLPPYARQPAEDSG